jgi:hypothetical protein
VETPPPPKTERPPASESSRANPLREEPPPYFKGRSLNPEYIADELYPDQLDRLGHPTDWEFISKHGGGPADISEYSVPGAKKVYEVWRDANGKLLEIHYELNPDGSVSHVRVRPYSPRKPK